MSDNWFCTYIAVHKGYLTPWSWDELLYTSSDVDLHVIKRAALPIEGLHM